MQWKVTVESTSYFTILQYLELKHVIYGRSILYGLIWFLSIISDLDYEYPCLYLHLKKNIVLICNQPKSICYIDIG